MTRKLAPALLALAAFACVEPWLQADAAGMVTVIQAHRAFNVTDIRVRHGDSVHFTNDDTFNHHVFVKSPSFSYESPEQAPGDVVDLKFPVAGTFDVQCGIHPRMHLAVNVD